MIYSCVEGAEPPLGEGNINTNPLFVESDHWDDNGTGLDLSDDTWIEGDYHLQVGSPCIDAGTSEGAPTFDIEGHGRPCGAGVDMFFLDPWGEVRPCNGMDSDSLDNSMGNLNKNSFDEIWNGEKAERIREKIRNCSKNCWMIGTASPAIKKNFIKPTLWVAKNKLKDAVGKEVCVD